MGVTEPAVGTTGAEPPFLELQPDTAGLPDSTVAVEIVPTLLWLLVVVPAFTFVVAVTLGTVWYFRNPVRLDNGTIIRAFPRGLRRVAIFSFACVLFGLGLNWFMSWTFAPGMSVVP